MPFLFNKVARLLNKKNWTTTYQKRSIIINIFLKRYKFQKIDVYKSLKLAKLIIHSPIC